MNIKNQILLLLSVGAMLLLAGCWHLGTTNGHSLTFIYAGNKSSGAIDENWSLAESGSGALTLNIEANQVIQWTAPHGFSISFTNKYDWQPVTPGTPINWSPTNPPQFNQTNDAYIIAQPSAGKWTVALRYVPKGDPTNHYYIAKYAPPPPTPQPKAARAIAVPNHQYDIIEATLSWDGQTFEATATPK